MSEEKNREINDEQTGSASPVFGLVRLVLIVILVCWLLFTFLKSNPRVQAMLQKWSDAQTGAVGGILSVSGETMGTYWNVKVSNPSKAWNDARLSDTAQGILDNADRLMSTYKEDSEVSRFNASGSTDWFSVSPETAQAAAIAQKTAAATGGALDITVAPLVNFWKFGPDKKPLDSFPSDTEIALVRAKTGYGKLDVRLDPPALKKSDPELTVDLSAVAKGCAVDAVAARLNEAVTKGEISGFMAEVGGEVRCGGINGFLDPGAPQTGVCPWTMGIERPVDSSPSVAGEEPDALPQLARVVRVTDGAIATSGGAKNALEIGGKRFSHIIDPVTGKPTELAEGAAQVGSVSVFLDTCGQADAFATAFFVLGPEKGIPLADRLGIPILYLMKNPDGTLREVTSQSFGKIDSDPVSAE